MALITPVNLTVDQRGDHKPFIAGLNSAVDQRPNLGRWSPPLYGTLIYDPVINGVYALVDRPPLLARGNISEMERVTPEAQHQVIANFYQKSLARGKSYTTKHVAKVGYKKTV